MTGEIILVIIVENQKRAAMSAVRERHVEPMEQVQPGTMMQWQLQ